LKQNPGHGQGATDKRTEQNAGQPDENQDVAFRRSARQNAAERKPSIANQGCDQENGNEHQDAWSDNGDEPPHRKSASFFRPG
jgi:hypothetical protein